MIKKESFLNLIVVSASFAFAISLAEIALRSIELIAYKAAQQEEYRQIYSDERNTPYLFHHHKNISVLLEKGEYNFTFDTDRNGFRGFNTSHDLSAPSILFLGDSVTEGASVETRDSFSNLIEKKLNLKTYNLGTGSYNTKHALELLKAKYNEDFNAKLIVLGYCLNDTSQNTYLRYFDPKLANWKIYKYLDEDAKGPQSEIPNITFAEKVKPILRDLKIYQLLSATKYRIKGSTPPNGDLYLLKDVDNKHLQYTKSHLQEIKNYASKINADLAVIIFPTEPQLNSSYDIESLQQTAIIRILDDLNIKHIPLYESFKDEYKSKPRERWFHDSIHPYKSGHKLIAEIISDWISSNIPLK